LVEDTEYDEEDDEEYDDVPEVRCKRVKTPTRIQMEATECGAASLAICLSYFGKFVPLTELREACGVSRDGSNALFVMKAARRYGLEADAFTTDPDMLQYIQGPMIVFWNFQHFVVVEGFTDEWVYINDPATGPRRIGYPDFDGAFTGVVIEVAVGEDFEKGGSEPSILEAVYERIAGTEKTIAFTSLAAFFLVIPSLATVALSKIFMDNVLGQGQTDWKWPLIFAMSFIALLTTLLSGLQGYVLNRLSTKLAIKYSSEFLWHILGLPMRFYSQRFGAEIANRMSLNTQVSTTMMGSVTTTLIDCFMMVVYGVLIFYYDVVIALIGISGVIGNIVILKIMNRLRMDSYSRLQADVYKSYSVAVGALSSIETIKATGTESRFFSRWAGYYTKGLNSRQELGRISAYYGAYPGLFQSLSTTALLGVGVWRVMAGKLTVGMLFALQMLLGKLMGPISKLVGLQQQLQLLRVDVNRLDDVLGHPIDENVARDRQRILLDDKRGVTKLDKVKLNGYVKLTNVDFYYNPNIPPVISQLSLSLSPGKSIALVGASGSGKSTATKIISGLYEPASGEILFDGKPRKDYPRHVLSSSIAVIEQEVFLFSGTIRDNLTLKDPTVTEEEVIRAAKDALIHDEIISRKGGYDLMLDEAGANLSGGQKQRMEIARSLIRNPSVLLLDEATSSLDSATEADVIKNIRRRGCACLMIAHRLSTVRNCDEIIVLERGCVVEKGTHEELKAFPGVYRSFIESEKKDEDETDA
jgi:ATP-binding cassette subfamily C protein